MAKHYTLKPSPGSINVTCVGFHLCAEDFLAAAEAYMPNARPGSFTAHFLCCQSIELSLKAFLSLKGLNRQLLKKLGHDLEKLLAKATLMGIGQVVTITNDHRRLLQFTNRWYDSRGGSAFSTLL